MQGNKLSAKADRAAIDEMQFKLASGGGAGGGGGGDGAMKVKNLIPSLRSHGTLHLCLLVVTRIWHDTA